MKHEKARFPIVRVVFEPQTFLLIASALSDSIISFAPRSCNFGTVEQALSNLHYSIPQPHFFKREHFNKF